MYIHMLFGTKKIHNRSDIFRLAQTVNRYQVQYLFLWQPCGHVCLDKTGSNHINEYVLLADLPRKRPGSSDQPGLCVLCVADSFRLPVFELCLSDLVDLHGAHRRIDASAQGALEHVALWVYDEVR